MSASSIRVKATWKEEDSYGFYLLLCPQHVVGVPSVLLGEWTFHLELEEWISSPQWPFLPGQLPGPTSLDLHPRCPPPWTWGCLLPHLIHSWSPENSLSYISILETPPRLLVTPISGLPKHLAFLPHFPICFFYYKKFGSALKKPWANLIEVYQAKSEILSFLSHSSRWPLVPLRSFLCIYKHTWNLLF